MIRLAPAPPPVAAGCRRRTRASLQSVVRWTEALPTHSRIPCVPPLPPRQTAAVGRPRSAFDNARHTGTGSSAARPFADRTPHELIRCLHTQPPSDRLPTGYDVARAFFQVDSQSPSQFNIGERFENRCRCSDAYHYKDNPRGCIIGEQEGFLKLILQRQDLKILGVHAIGELASELVHIGLMAMTAGCNATVFSDTSFNVPTLGALYQDATWRLINEARARQTSPMLAIGARS
jgi:hypothetical protein